MVLVPPPVPAAAAVAIVGMVITTKQAAYSMYDTRVLCCCMLHHHQFSVHAIAHSIFISFSRLLEDTLFLFLCLLDYSKILSLLLLYPYQTRLLTSFTSLLHSSSKSHWTTNDSTLIRNSVSPPVCAHSVVGL